MTYNQKEKYDSIVVFIKKYVILKNSDGMFPTTAYIGEQICAILIGLPAMDISFKK